jgi:hypothetical protein
MYVDDMCGKGHFIEEAEAGRHHPGSLPRPQIAVEC